MDEISEEAKETLGSSGEVPGNELKFQLTVLGVFVTLLYKQSILQYNQLRSGLRDEIVSASFPGLLCDVNALSSD